MQSHLYGEIRYDPSRARPARHLAALQLVEIGQPFRLVFKRLRRFTGPTVHFHLASRHAGRTLEAVQLPFLGSSGHAPVCNAMRPIPPRQTRTIFSWMAHEVAQRNQGEDKPALRAMESEAKARSPR